MSCQDQSEPSVSAVEPCPVSSLRPWPLTLCHHSYSWPVWSHSISFDHMNTVFIECNQFICEDTVYNNRNCINCCNIKVFFLIRCSDLALECSPSPRLVLSSFAIDPVVIAIQSFSIVSACCSEFKKKLQYCIYWIYHIVLVYHVFILLL